MKKKAIDPDRSRARRVRTYEEMTPAARAAADLFADWARKETRALMLIHYDQGAMVNAAEAEPELYGGNPARDLAAFFPRPAAFYRALGAFARRFDRAEVEAWAGRVCPNGRRLEWQHLVEASRLVRAGDRRALLERAVSGCWTLLDLRSAIDAAGLPSDPLGRWDEPVKRRPQRRRGGRTPRLTGTPDSTGPAVPGGNAGEPHVTATPTPAP